MQDMPKTSTLEYKGGLHSPSLHSPVKADQPKAMEGYNVQFGGGLPAPVLPVRNNLRRPGPGRVGGSASSGGRGPSSPLSCSWRCTAIVFITVAVMLAAILVYIAATSSLAWSAQGGCAVLVDDPTVLDDESHHGQSGSRGNLHHRRHHQGPQGQHRHQGQYIVYLEGRPHLDEGPLDLPLEPASPPRPHRIRRMRRSVSHDELDSQPLPSAPSMDTYPLTHQQPTPDLPQPSPSPASTQTPQPGSTTHPLPTTLSDSRPTMTTDSPDSTTNTPSSHSRSGFAKVLFVPEDIKNSQVRSKESSDDLRVAEIVSDVHAPVIDIVEYSNSDDAFVPKNVIAGLEGDIGDDGIVTGEEEQLEYAEERDYGADNYGEEANEPSVVTKGEPDYVYNHQPDDEYDNIVEYENSDSELENDDDEDLNTDDDLTYETIPGTLLTEDVPDPLSIMDPSALMLVDDPMGMADDAMDLMMGDDPMAMSGYELTDMMLGDDPSAFAAQDRSKRRSFRGWMGAFPTIEPETTMTPEDTSENVTTATTGVDIATTEAIIEAKSWEPENLVLDTWFSRYGLNDKNETSSQDQSEDDDENHDNSPKRYVRSRKRTSFDPRDPQGGPIPQSDPGHYPSRILESLGASPDNGRDTQGPRMAKDLFPHIFEYDLDDHDDYYYDDPVYYYDDATFEPDKRLRKIDIKVEGIEEEEDSVDVIMHDDIGHARPAYRDPHTIVTLRPPPRRSQLRATSAPISATQYPPGLRAMSLTKEVLHVPVMEPQVAILPRGGQEVVEIEVVPLSSRVEDHSLRTFHTGSDYSQQHRTWRDRTTTTSTRPTTTPTTTTSTTTTTTTTTTTPPPTTKLTTPTPTNPPRPPAKFLNTKTPEEPHQVQFAVVPDNQQQQQHHGSDSSFRSKLGNIPKFLVHKTEQFVDYLKSPETLHYAAVPAANAEKRDANEYQPLSMNTHHIASQMNSHNTQVPDSGSRSQTSHTYSSQRQTGEWDPPRAQIHSRDTYTNPQKTSSLEEVEYIPRGRSLDAREDSSIRITRHDQSSAPEVSPMHDLISAHPRSSRRVTVNVTIATEDETKPETGPITSSKPLYFLSVSVPTSNEDQAADINIVKPDDQQQIATLSLTVRGNKTYDDSQPPSDLSSYQPSVPERLVSHVGAVDKCQCPCSCKDNGAVPGANSIPIPPAFLPGQVTSDSIPNDPRTQDSDKQQTDAQDSSSSQGCRLAPVPSDLSTVPPIPQQVIDELEEHKSRPSKTIPPDGTTFNMMELGDRLEEKIPPYGYWNMQFYQVESAYVRFEVTIPRGSSIGIYGRRNALPTHTSYDFLQVMSGYKTTTGQQSGGHGRSARSAKVIAPAQMQTMTRYLEQGHWFLSLYNDDGDPQEVGLTGDISTEFTEGCPKGCSGNGDCILGSCQCHPGFAGPDCTQMKCPVLCSGHGEYKDGECVCRPGWKGRECSIRHDECEVPDCNDHGHCVDGKCRCAKGFKGEFCEEDDCPHPTCNGHGWCVAGRCVCQKGWREADCGTTDDAALHCLPDCSGHGQFDLESHQCVCEPEWTGSECNTRVCGLDCGTHGRCEGGACLCSQGWTGEHCHLLTCDPRCEEHGQCKNGTCICMTGWNGRHCTLAGCPSSCSGHGACIMEEEEWTCSCEDGWEGFDCSVKLETQCSDNIDNDKDGLVDCADAECCSDLACQHSTLCLTSIDPIDILLRKQPPAVTASFFQRMRFLVEEGSVQNYAKGTAFNESRASVVRGRVISGRGTGLRGVRVSHYRPADTGFTLTRPGGWFDLMVNGGGAVRLLFGKAPFLPVTETVWVPWNEIVVIDTVVMTTADIVPPPQPMLCPDHNYDALKPVVLATWKHGFQGGCPERTAILTESQVVQESLSIPGTGLHLVYHSSRALGYESTIQLQLTPSAIPDTLRRIYLRITIEGILFEKTFEADPDIKFTYAWNRLNVYRQRVYGVTWAVVKVGFAYSNCDQVIWDAQTTQVSGHDMSISDIGGWDLSVHHRYNFHEGILQKGDGRNIHLKQMPRVLRNLLGDGHQREVLCRSCDGPAEKQRLLTPAALAPGPDGSLYIADFNLIRRVMPDTTVKTVVMLNETRVSYRYHLAVSPVTGDVYISDHEAHLILKVRDPDDFSRPEDNFMPAVGSGERCLPGDEVGCGDGSLARDAKLQYPKGMAVSLDDVLYFADGTNVRAVDSDGIITTVIGTHRHRAHWRPLPCEGTVPVSEVSLRWPTALAVSPLDDSLYVLDDHHVLRLTRDGQIKVVAGRPLHCPSLGHDAPSDLAAHTTLRSPQSLAFAPTGDLYIAESDNERINRVRVIETDERIHDFAGADSKCNCQEESCKCYNEAHVLAATAVFSTISALAVTPDGTVHVLDQGNLRIRSVTSSIPEPNIQRLYEIFSPETQEVYVFNRFGHHVATRSIPTGRTIYSFAYNVNTSNGKLSTVTDAGGNRVSFLRDYTGQVTMVENSRQQKCRIHMSRARRIEEFVTPDEHNVTLTYHGATGLLRSRMDSTGRAHVYTYDKYGRLTRTVTPSGQVIDLAFDLSQKGARVTLTRDGTAPVAMLIKGALVTETIGSASSVTARLPDGSVITRSPWGHHIATETVPYTLLPDHTLQHSFPVSGRQRTEIGNELVNSFDWKYFVEPRDHSGPVTQVGRKMRVNGEDLLTFKYDLGTGTEAVLNEVGATLLNVTYDPLGRPLKWSPAQPFLPVQMKYDRFGHLEEWSWGDMKERYSYDRAGRYEGVTYADSTTLTYSFKDQASVKPYKVSVGDGSEHLLEHDEGGALSAVTTPRGHKYTFHVQPSLLHNRFTFTPPGSPRHPYQLFYNDGGKVLAEVLPHQAGRVIYHHNPNGRLHLQIYGDGSVEYRYHPETGLVRAVEVRERGFEMRSDNKYHGGLIKEQRIRYGSYSGLDSAKLRFLYDGFARPRRVEVEINGKDQPDYDMKYNMILGTLDSVADLKVTSSYHNKTVIQDLRKIMLRITEFDPHGRIVESALTLRSRLVYRTRYGYDKRGRLASMATWRGPGTTEKRTDYTYTPDGFLQAVEGADSWQFRYDANGNMIAVVEGGREMTATYDGADRLVGWGDVELNTYSPGGAVVRQGEVHLSYNARGNLRSAWQQGQYKVWCRHDHHGRLAVWQDDKGNVTQFFYADVRRPDVPTHIHYPKRGVTHTLEYDERGHLMSIHTGKRRLWVSTDHLGSPLAVFDDSGVLVKEVVRSPWGATLSDSQPDLLLHVDFQGGLRDPVTGLITFGLHTYDPVHAMWMFPRYDLVTVAPSHVGAVYVHRFHDNDPMNPPRAHHNHYTDLNSWLRLYGVDISHMLGSSYHDETVDQQRKGLLMAPQLAPSLSVISGLSCSTEGVLDQFSQPSLLPESKVLSDAPAWSIPGWEALGRFTSSPPMLGAGVMVSRVDGRAVVSLVPSRENSVVQDVARDVLNGSALLNVTLTHHRHHTLYLVKENSALRHDDLQQLQRLSGRFNVTTRDEGEHHEIRVLGTDVSIIIMYGLDSNMARHRLLRHAHHRAVERAWEMERSLAERGSPTHHDWTVEERAELISSGTVTGFIAADVHSIHRFPLLADDPTNVVFRPDTGRRRRRSRDTPHA